ncbi:restriction of telomere capping protein 3 [Trichomonascus vanleenenianus]|uniref:Rtc3p n=1 Tax=Trichomonascus vanleenenianus TaxID=2268995 RepID=UPI003ECBA25D
MATSEKSVRVFWKGDNEDFIVWAQSKDALNRYKKDTSVPMVEVVDLYKVFVTHRHGSQGVYDQAPNGALLNEFGTKNEDEVIRKILLDGEVQGGHLIGSRDQGNIKVQY